MYLLDSNACIRILNGASPPLQRRLRSCSPTEVSLCSVVKAELYFGARKSERQAENLRLVDRFFSVFPSFDFDDRCAEIYGATRNELERSGTPIGPNDLLIAATAIANELILVTHNTREFERVVGLHLEDWEAE
jgi:tRNA(fMet)-specific endonuclease VapC